MSLECSVTTVRQHETIYYTTETNQINKTSKVNQDDLQELGGNISIVQRYIVQ